MSLLASLIGVTSVTGCVRRASQGSTSADARYVLGPPWRGDGYWFYPRQESAYTATGLAVIDVPRPPDRSRTADGEVYDPASFTASHQTLQLPVVLRVLNLENGRVVDLRVNDRGPAAPGRLLSVTPGAARVLGMRPNGATRVRVTEDSLLSQLILRSVHDAPVSDFTAAPVAAVQEQSLTSSTTRPPAEETAPLSTRPPEAGPAQLVTGNLVQEFANPGRLWIDAGSFSQRSYARHLASTLSGTIREQGQGRSVSFSVRLGPFDLVTQADAALDRAHAGGVTDARIVVE